MREENIYILFITDECTRYTRGQVIKSKQPQEVIKAIETNWILRGPGWPSGGFYSDRGTELQASNHGRMADVSETTLQWTGW